VATSSLKDAEAVTAGIALALRSQKGSNSEKAEVLVEQNIAKVSIAGAGMIGRPGVAAKMFAALAADGIHIQMISTSETKVSCVINAADCKRGVAALCKAFEINAPSPSSHTCNRTPTYQASLASPVRGVALDENQARFAIRQVPDRLGMTAKLFGLLAQHNISVDMIVQSQHCQMVNGVPMRDIAFTVAKTDARTTWSVLQQATADLGYGEILLDSVIAKVSIVGAAIASQPGVAFRMFETLAQHQINIQMIATSEMKISCIVAQEQGVIALKAIHTAFGLANSQKSLVSV
jgi:aspartate kinase